MQQEFAAPDSTRRYGLQILYCSKRLFGQSRRPLGLVSCVISLILATGFRHLTARQREAYG